MSYQALAWARTIRTGSHTVKAVLMAVANYADEYGTCFPSQVQLAEDTELSRHTVMRCLETLEQAGALRRERRHRTDGSRKSDLITLNLSSADQRSRDQRSTEQLPKSQGATAEPITEPSLTPCSPPSRGSKKGTQLSEDWETPFDVVEFAAKDAAERKLVPLTAPEALGEVGRMKDWARQTGAVKKDWPATLRNWIRRANDDKQVRIARSGGKPIAQGPNPNAGRRLYAHRGTPQWDAWIEHYRRTGQPMKWLEGKSQMQVPSEWPPQERAA